MSNYRDSCIQVHSPFRAVGLLINSRLSPGESVGNIAGLTVSYDPNQRAIARKARPVDITGLTAESISSAVGLAFWQVKLRPRPNANRSPETQAKKWI